MVATIPPPRTRRPAAGDESDETTPSRTITRRIGLPSGRAVVGALLMTVAAVGVFVTATGATDDPRSAHVVAATELPAGGVLTAADLETKLLDLDPALDRLSFADPSELVGRRLLAPVGDGELIQRSAVAESASADPHHELTFSVSSSRALDGQLRAGDRIDVYVTLDQTTRTVARGVELLAAPSEAGRGEVVLRVALADESTVLDLVDAVNRGDVTVVRSTHADEGAGG